MAQPRRWLIVLLALVLLAPCVLCDPLEGFDDQDAPPVATAQVVEEAQDAGPAAQAAQAPVGGNAASAFGGTAAFGTWSWSGFRNNINAFYVEIWAAGMLVVYLLCLVVGFIVNKGVAEAWVREYVKPGTLLANNFAYTGPGSGMGLMRHSASNFMLYASGRRNCRGMLAELSLVPRQDLASLLWCMATPWEDTLTIEVYMAEAAMPPIVLAVATPKAAKRLQERSDVSRYTKRISTGKEMPAFSQSAGNLCVLAEHSGVVADLLGDEKTQSLLSSSAAAMKHFRSLHFTSDNTASKNKHVLTFTFKLPGSCDMAAIAPLMELVPHFIDAVASYKMPPDLRKRALDARAKVAAAVAAEGAKDEKQKRQEALTQKRADAAEAMRARVVRMNPEARAKAEEKLAAKASKKEMRRGTVMKRGG
ncbi:hypothetical protein FOA52_013393 [Chlamydomonas sp. UWO 241]|nr:hypothetical protein FOA52_013393 [Chlamydomonas sp. UWO 241]